ncbi:hypothetical protein M413DRAFT_10949 [Hebeloma cylindrosporum]|uniref:F-box domain-containing protein n=1 Tax=Hebeloma cylindrosporum TaxID=76867 RepID=A0A0C3BXK9_HEBCY|nr:hypothetical protein M413DRAFT_10949 [Hebeloma cylindrosporum h7]
MAERIVPISILPVEILLDIIKSFRQLAQPLLLSHISICAFCGDVRKQSSSFEGKSVNIFKNALVKNLEGAIRSLKNVNKVIWKIGQDDPLWTFEHIFNGLSAIQLRDIKVVISQRDLPFLRLSALSNLQRICLEWKKPYYALPTSLSSELAKLIGKCPILSCLEVNARGIHLSDLFQLTTSAHHLEQLSLLEVEVSPKDAIQNLHHLRHLKSFGLCRNVLHFESDSGGLTQNLSNGEIWNIFEKQKIELETIITDSIHDDSLTSYLSSYRGLERLTLYLGKPLAAPVEPDHLLLCRVFGALASHHADSLLELDLFAETSADEEAFWPFQEEILELLPAFVNLRGFGVTEWGATSFHSVAAVQESIKSLISVCTENFPNLRRLNIHPAGDVFARYERHPSSHGRKYLFDTVLSQTFRYEFYFCETFSSNLDSAFSS